MCGSGALTTEDFYGPSVTDDGQAGSMLPGLAQTNAFVQPVGHGWVTVILVGGNASQDHATLVFK